MVVAYGTAKGIFTGSASVINNKKLELRPISNVTKGIGRTDYRSVNNFRLRSTWRSCQDRDSLGYMVPSMPSQDPLYVVDGIPFSGDRSSINPADIESMTVLKMLQPSPFMEPVVQNGVIMITPNKERRQD